jgi:formylglycine-generating enzyme required for sulfatase activity
MIVQFIEPELLRVPSGYFWMGSHNRDTNAWNTEKTYHRVNLEEYWIGRYPVTNREFQCFISENPNYQIRKDVDYHDPHIDKPSHPYYRIT